MTKRLVSASLSSRASACMLNICHAQIVHEVIYITYHNAQSMKRKKKKKKKKDLYRVTVTGRLPSQYGPALWNLRGTQKFGSSRLASAKSDKYCTLIEARCSGYRTEILRLYQPAWLWKLGLGGANGTGWGNVPLTTLSTVSKAYPLVLHSDILFQQNHSCHHWVVSQCALFMQLLRNF